MWYESTDFRCAGGCGTPTSACEYATICAVCYQAREDEAES